MPKRFDFSEIAQDYAMGATSLAGEIAQAARGVYCTFAQNSPFSVMYNNPLTSPIVTRALNSLCGQPPPPPPPSPFQGGQCPAVLYRVNFEYKITESADLVVSSQNVWGSIRGIEAADYSATLIELRIVAGDGTPADNEKTYNIKFANASQNPFPYYTITSVERRDGNPDDCGSLPDSWYPEAPPLSDSDITNVDVSITNNNGDVNNYNVTINRSPDGHIKFPPVINVSGVAVGIDVTGISVGEVNINRRSGGGGGGADINQPTADGGGEPETIEEEPQEVGEDSPGEDVENLVGIYVDITSMPRNAKIVYGNGAPDIIYAGWIEYKREDGYFPRQFIDFQKSWYPAPKGNTGYAITLKTGYTGQVRKVLKE